MCVCVSKITSAFFVGRFRRLHFGCCVALGFVSTHACFLRCPFDFLVWLKLRCRSQSAPTVLVFFSLEEQEESASAFMSAFNVVAPWQHCQRNQYLQWSTSCVLSSWWQRIPMKSLFHIAIWARSMPVICVASISSVVRPRPSRPPQKLDNESRWRSPLRSFATD